MGFSVIDSIVVIVYLVGVAIFGIISGGKQKSSHDYFLGGRSIPWWAVCFAIVATETSTLTFISIPGVAYLTNFNFLQLTFGYILGRILIAILFLPAYFKGNLETAYAFLGHRFGNKMRSASSAVFMITRLFADGVRLYATAIPIKLITGVDYPTAIILTAVVTLVYTYIGGVRAVVWMDVVQMFIYLGGALMAVWVLGSQIPGGLFSVFHIPNINEKLSVINFGFNLDIKTFFSTPYTLIGSVAGGMFLSMASHGTDHLIVQRLLATDSLASSRKAIVTSSVIIMFQFAIFLFIGLLLYTFYNGAKMDANEVFPRYIISYLPQGIAGLIIAGLLAAAMSTLAGSMNSLASALMFDFYKPYSKKVSSPETDLKLSRIYTGAWCVLLIASAFIFMNTSKTVVELALSIASFTYGGLLGTFLLGVLSKKVKQQEALIAFTAGILIMVAVIYFTSIAWTWYTVIGSVTTVVVGMLLSNIFGNNKQ
jgi:solute:Na+ symporter, SSS family